MIGEGLQQVEIWDEVLAKFTPDKVLFVGDPEAIPAMGTLLRETLGRQADVMRSHARFIEVIPKGADKGSGLAWLARHLGVPRESVMAVGDHENDGSMVQWAGVGVAMGNAVPGLKAAADWVAPGLEADGAAAALERFVLMDSGGR
jgi:hydroxymethylpyrimidine pyrophosphatase-like HAD family hydrolase